MKNIVLPWRLRFAAHSSNETFLQIYVHFKHAPQAVQKRSSRMTLTVKQHGHIILDAVSVLNIPFKSLSVVLLLTALRLFGSVSALAARGTTGGLVLVLGSLRGGSNANSRMLAFRLSFSLSSRLRLELTRIIRQRD